MVKHVESEEHASMVLDRDFLHLPIIGRIANAFAAHMNLAVDKIDDLDIALDEGIQAVKYYGNPDAPVSVKINHDKTLGLSVTLSTLVGDEGEQGVEEVAVASPGMIIARALVDASVFTVRDGVLYLTLNVKHPQGR